MDVLILLGSKSDLDVARACSDTLKQFDVKHKLVVASAHRTPELVEQNLKEAEQSGTKVIVAMAGLAAHLPGVVASKTLIPVIGVPISSKNTGGLDALYSIVQMPSGYPVATVAIDGAKNAALLAMQIIANNDEKLRSELFSYRQKMKQDIIKSNEGL